ncbi:unnamed protein product [Penicillium viridicatum]
MAASSQSSKMHFSKDPPSYEETTQVSKAARIQSLVSQLELYFQIQGSHKLARSVCYYYHLEYASNDKSWCKALIQADIEIRWIVQRIIWVHQQIQDCRTQAFELYLKGLNPRYWRAYAKLWIAMDRIKSRSAARGLERQRMHVDWYAKIVRGEEVAVSGRADVAKDHERLMDLEQKGCTTEATALQHAPVVWMPTG